MSARSLLAFVACCLICLISPGCGESDPPTEPDLRPDLGAIVETIEKGWYPLGSSESWNVCTGEWVDIEGDFNLVVRQITTPSGNVIYQVHSVAVHVLGTGRSSGMQYVSNEHFNYTDRSGEAGTGFVIEFAIRWVAKGAAPNVSGKMQITLVADGNGDIVLDRFRAFFDQCSGGAA